MALEGAHAAIDDIITRTRLHQFRQAGGTDEQFVEDIIREFNTEARNHPAGAGATHMALSVYRMVMQQEQIYELNDQVEMRNDALKTLWEIDEL